MKDLGSLASLALKFRRADLQSFSDLSLTLENNPWAFHSIVAKMMPNWACCQKWRFSAIKALRSCLGPCRAQELMRHYEMHQLYTYFLFPAGETNGLKSAPKVAAIKQHIYESVILCNALSSTATERSTSTSPCIRLYLFRGTLAIQKYRGCCWLNNTFQTFFKEKEAWEK